VSTVVVPDVELILDLRELHTRPDSREAFGKLWGGLEPALYGRDLRSKTVHELQGPNGTLRIEVARIAAGTGLATPRTRFAVVAVREPSKLRHRCTECAEASIEEYGPFRCPEGPPAQEHRACNKHVVILDGSLAPRCGAHHPRCADCHSMATFWCAGKSCDRKTAWCDRHRRFRPQDQDVSYCPNCYTRQFPGCEYSGCRNIGTIACEHVSRALEPCGRRVCTLHARRWQVYGPERMGLGRCSQHARLAGVPVDDLILQIVAGTANRRRLERMPTLRGFAHNLRNARKPEPAPSYKVIFGTLGSLGDALGRAGGVPAAVKVGAALEKAMPGWREEYGELVVAAEEGERLAGQLRQVVQERLRDGYAIAANITLSEYKPQLRTLFINLDPDYRGRFIGTGGVHRQEYERRLGVAVRFEGDRQRKEGDRQRK